VKSPLNGPEPLRDLRRGHLPGLRQDPVRGLRAQAADAPQTGAPAAPGSGCAVILHFQGGARPFGKRRAPQSPDLTRGSTTSATLLCYRRNP